MRSVGKSILLQIGNLKAGVSSGMYESYPIVISTEEETTEPSMNEENTDTDNEESVDDFLAELSGDEDNTTPLESDMDTLSIEDTQTPEETDADFAELDELDDLDLTTTEESQTVEEHIQPEQNSDEELNLDDLTEIEDTPIETTNAENTTTEEDFITERPVVAIIE